MDAITKYFVRAKHWQIFMLLGGSGVAGFIGFIGILSLLYKMNWSSPSEPALNVIAQAVELPSALCLFGWWWSIGSLLHILVKPTRELNMNFFSFAFIY